MLISSQVSNIFTQFKFIIIVWKEQTMWVMYCQSFTALACFLHSSYYVQCFKTCHFVFPNLFVRWFPDLSLLPFYFVLLCRRYKNNPHFHINFHVGLIIPNFDAFFTPHRLIPQWRNCIKKVFLYARIKTVYFFVQFP